MLVVPLAAFVVWAIWDNAKLFFITLLNGLTLASLYFIVAAGFTLVFGLMRNVNLAHGSLYLLGGYIGYFVAETTGYFVLALAAGFLGAALVGLADAGGHLPLHAGTGPAPDDGDHRPVDHHRRPADLGHRRDGASDERPGLARRSAAQPAGDHRLLEIPDGAAAARESPSACCCGCS